VLLCRVFEPIIDDDDDDDDDDDALRKHKPPPTPKFKTKVVHDSTPDFRINPDTDLIC